MATYFFQIFADSPVIWDEIGVDMEDDEQVKREALRVVIDVARDVIKRKADCHSITVLVTNDAGRLVNTVTMSMVSLWLGNDGPDGPGDVDSA